MTELSELLLCRVNYYAVLPLGDRNMHCTPSVRPSVRPSVSPVLVSNSEMKS